MHEEIADVVDERDEVVGRAPRSQIRREKLLHRGVAVVVRNSAGAVYVHRRSDIKDVFPGQLAPFVSGMVASGETYEETARRELEEELGISGAPLRHVTKLRVTSGENPHWVCVYETIWDGHIVADVGEISWGAFLPEDELAHRMNKGGFSPDGREVWHRCFGAI